MSDTPQVSAVIVAYENPDILRFALDPLANDANVEIIVVDNSSTDLVATAVLTDYPRVRLIRMGWNSGFGHASNIGAEASTGRLILFLNQDCAITTINLGRCVNALAATSATILGCRLETADGTFDHAAKRSLPDPWSSLNYFARRALGRDVSSANYLAPDIGERDSGWVGAVNGAFMLMTRDDYQRLEGFDTNFWMYMEDLDLCARASTSGNGCYYLGEVTAIHLKSAISGRHRPWWLSREFDRSMNYYYEKHFRSQYRSAFGVVVRSAILMRTPLFWTRDSFTSAATRSQ